MLFPRNHHRVKGGCIAQEDRYGRLAFGHPHAWHHGEDWVSARLAFHLNVHRIPRLMKDGGEGVLHTCLNHWCINPDHLYLGTMSQRAKAVHAARPELGKRFADMLRDGGGDRWTPEMRAKVAHKARERDPLKGHREKVLAARQALVDEWNAAGATPEAAEKIALRLGVTKKLFMQRIHRMRRTRAKS